MRAVYVSRPGVVCSCADSSTQLWKAVTNANQDSIRQVKSVSGKNYFAAKVLPQELKTSSSRIDMHISRIEEKALSQLDETVKLAAQKWGSDRIAVCVGSCDNASETSFAAHKTFLETGSFPSDYSLEKQSADFVASLISERYGVKGPSLAFSTACSSSAGATIKAAELIASGFADAVIAGGVDIASDTTLLGFDSLEAVSPLKTNPFSKNRKGITLGDAAAFFLLSKEPLSSSGEDIILSGYGESADAFHMTSPEPSATGAVRAMKKALKKANLLPEDISYVNLHGTGTHANDEMEARAVREVFSDSVPCSSTKSVTGHTLGAASALEAAVCWETLFNNRNAKEKGSVLPFQVWDFCADDTMPAVCIVSERNPCSTKSAVCHVMSNSFAFGGSNASLIFSMEESK